MESFVLISFFLVLVCFVSHKANAIKTIHIDGGGGTRVVEYLTENFYLNCNSLKHYDTDGLLNWKTDGRRVRACGDLKKPGPNGVCMNRSRNSTHRMALLMFGKIYKALEGSYACYRQSFLQQEEKQSIFVKVVVRRSAPPVSVSILWSWQTNDTLSDGFEKVCCSVRSLINEVPNLNTTWNNGYGEPIREWLRDGSHHMVYQTKTEKCSILHYLVNTNRSRVYICEVVSPYYNNTVTKAIIVPVTTNSSSTVTRAVEELTDSTSSWSKSSTQPVTHSLAGSEEMIVPTLTGSELSNDNRVVIVSMSIAGIVLVMFALIIYYRLKRTSPSSWDGPDQNFIMVERQIAKKLSSLQKGVVKLQPEQLELVDVIGKGFFGVVCKARVKDSIGFQGHKNVAIKMVNDEMDTDAYSSLVDEAILMSRFGGHSHVVTLVGLCLQTKGCPWLIIELAEHGNLRGYLRSRRPHGTTLNRTNSEEHPTPDGHVPSISTEKTLFYALQIAKGMEHLISQMCLHRDLAARNVLVFGEEWLKISDFGLAKDIHYQEYYRKQSAGIIPVKWTAPEALFQRVYSEASDVWSFGVVLWEIVTRGGTPYPGVDVGSLYRLLSGTPPYRMSRPRGCSQAVYDLMIYCWKSEPSCRPTFSTLVTDITQLTLDAAKNEDSRTLVK